MFSTIICPVSADRINSHTSRITVFLNTVLMVGFLLTLQPVYLYVVFIDYFIRAWGYNKISPIANIALLITKVLNLSPKMIDKAPKVFASRLGLICAVLGAVFYLAGNFFASRIVISFFCILTFLDSVVNVCVGCLIYNYLVFPYFRKNSN